MFKKIITMTSSGAMLAPLLLAPALVMAKVDSERAQKLGAELTFIGAEKSANADGTIPAWTGGFSLEEAKLSNPYSAEKVLYTIDQNNVADHQDKLSAGQVALINKYPETYKINVYPTHRSAAYPQAIYDATKANATRIEMNAAGSGLVSEMGSSSDKGYQQGVPFPIPQSAEEILWNHITRYRGGQVDRIIHRIAPQVSGSYIPYKIWQQMAFSSHVKGSDADDNMLFYFIGETLEPARSAGTMILVNETLDQLKEPRKAWVYNAGQRRVRRAPQVAYDTPQNNSDGQATSDNQDMYNGSPDRYEWNLVGKKEMLIPYNNYQLHSKELTYDEIIKPGHVNSDLTRYELHRVWQVEGTLKDGLRHVYKKRTFYIDEDTWQIAVADHFDERGELWRIAESYHMNFHNAGVPWYTAEAIYDLNSGRYLVSGLSNEVSEPFKFGGMAKKSEFKPSALRRKGGKH
jgi:hypothetical protein